MNKFVFLLFLFFANSVFAIRTLDPQLIPQEVLQGTRPDYSKKSPQLLLLDFWASWCGPCRESLPQYNKLQKKYADRGIQFLAINVDEDKKDALEFLKEVKVEFPVLRDADRKFSKEFKLEAIPSLIILDKDLNVISIERGYNSKKAEALAKKIEMMLKN